MRPIKFVYIHCTDSDDSLDIGFREINEWHIKRGFLSPSGISCGYHYIVRRNGTIQHGRPDAEKGAHVEGHNWNSIGIVWVGRKNPDPRQMKALYQQVRNIVDKYTISIDNVLGHCESNPGKTCPNIDMNKFRAELLFVKSDQKS